MMFLDHTVTWVKGEAHEAWFIAFAGIAVLLMATILWKCALTPAGRALPMPLFVVGMIFLVAGISGSQGTANKLEKYKRDFERSSISFVYAEKSRVKAFEAIYTYTIISAGVAFAIAAMTFLLSENPTCRAIALALALMGLSALVIDMFSKERAANYERAIDTEIMRLNLMIKHSDDFSKSTPRYTKGGT